MKKFKITDEKGTKLAEKEWSQHTGVEYKSLHVNFMKIHYNSYIHKYYFLLYLTFFFRYKGLFTCQILGLLGSGGTTVAGLCLRYIWQNEDGLVISGYGSGVFLVVLGGSYALVSCLV